MNVLNFKTINSSKFAETGKYRLFWLTNKNLSNYNGNFAILKRKRIGSIYSTMMRKLIEGCVLSYQSYDDGGMCWYQSCDHEGV